MIRPQILLLGTLLASCAFARDRTPPTWSDVERLAPGQRVRVLCADQREWMGRLKAVSADSLTMDADKPDKKPGVSLPRAGIVRVQIRSRKRPALIGLAIGLAGGVAITAYLAQDSKPLEQVGPVLLNGSMFGGIGAGIGALLPGWRTVLRLEASDAPGKGRTRR